jgi:hypothetical protein
MVLKDFVLPFKAITAVLLVKLAFILASNMNNNQLFVNTFYFLGYFLSSAF